MLALGEKSKKNKKTFFLLQNCDFVSIFGVQKDLIYKSYETFFYPTDTVVYSIDNQWL